jgi:hypothetical protein
MVVFLAILKATLLALLMFLGSKCWHYLWNTDDIKGFFKFFGYTLLFAIAIGIFVEF